MNLPWLIVQLAGYSLAFLAVLAASVALIVGPPILLGRAAWRHLHR